MPTLPPYRYHVGEIPEQLSRWLELARQCINSAATVNQDTGQVGDSVYLVNADDEIIASDDTLTPDTDFNLELATLSVYAIEGAFKISGVSGGFQFRIDGPEDGSYRFSVTENGTPTETNGSAQIGETVTIPDPLDLGLVIEISGLCRTDVAAPTFTLEIAQSTSDVAELTWHQGNWIRLTRLIDAATPINPPNPATPDPIVGSPYAGVVLNAGRMMTWLPFNERPDDKEPRLVRDIGDTRMHGILMGDLSDYIFNQPGPGDPGMRSITIRHGTSSGNRAGIILPHRGYEDLDPGQNDDNMISIWIKPFGSGDSIPVWNVGSTFTGSGAGTVGNYFYVNSSGALVCFNSTGAGGSGGILSDTTPLVTNAWNWLAWRMAGSTWELWHNGVLLTSSVFTGTNTGDSIEEWNWNSPSLGFEPICIGCSFGNNNAPTYVSENFFAAPSFSVGYSTLQIWDERIPTPAQMLDIYNQGITP